MTGLVNRAQVSREGKVSLPAAQRRAAGIAPGSEVIVEQVGQELRIRSVAALLDDLAARAARLVAGTDDSVDQFLADRRAAAARDEDQG
jgi:bifunctional DNA-binding transcriptional regulator/antitoxin component of YhaV-PrlF toxin-antitoxin module